MDAQTRDSVRDHLLNRIAAEPDLRELLLTDQDAALQRTFGRGMPDGVTLHVVEETPEQMYLVLPLPGPDRNAAVTLREIDAETVRQICALEVRPDQKGFVAPNANSLALAAFSPHAWVRAVYAEDTPVGFVMLNDDAESPKYFLWRFMIDARYQRFGFGRKALEEVIAYVRTRPNATELLLSYEPGPGGPREFYQRLGFEDTGEQIGGENIMRLAL